MVALQKNQAITSAGLKVINAFGYCCNFVINDGNAELRQVRPASHCILCTYMGRMPRVINFPTLHLL